MGKREKPEFDVLGRIESERQKRSWTEYTLARNSGITQSTISTWYRKGLQPSIASLEKICSGLGISLSQFFQDADSDSEILTDEQRDLLTQWSILDPDKRLAILNMLKAFTSN